MALLAMPCHRTVRRFPSSGPEEEKQNKSPRPKAPQARQVRSWPLLWLLTVLAALVLFLLFPRWPQQSKVMDASDLAVDYVGLVARPTCVNQFVLKKLLQHQRPRRIFLIVPDTEACQERLGSISPIVKCIQEDSLFPDITKALVAAALESYYPQLQGDAYLKGRTLSGWYLQQLLKLAVLQALPELSELYVIWDMDMIPARHIPLVYLPSSEISSIGASDALQLPMSTSVMSMHSQPVRTVVNIGGAWSPGYGQSYEKLLHKKLVKLKSCKVIDPAMKLLLDGIKCKRHVQPTFAEDGTSFVTHWIVVQKALMQRFLDVLCPNTSELSSSGCKWHNHILQNLPEDEISHGFSEYHSYVSFVKQNWPQTQYEMRKKTWMRQPIGGQLGVKLARMGTKGGLCCPTMWQDSLQALAGYDYYGLEAGHHPECRWKDPEFQTYYGPR